MNWRDAVMWVSMVAMIVALYWLHTIHLIRTDFNLFLGAVLLLSAAVTVLAWIVRPEADEHRASQHTQPAQDSRTNVNETTTNH